MTLTTFPNVPDGPEKVRVRILDHTVCELGDVAKGEIVEVSKSDFAKLKDANKAELVVDPTDDTADETAAAAELLRADLDKMSKADLVAGAKAKFGLELSAAKPKAEIVDAIVKATLAAVPAAAATESGQV
jgi:hypothetical protein